MFRTKIIRAETKLLDEEGGRVSAIVSSESQDRDGDIIRVEGWNLKSFLKHPVLLSSHDYRSLRSQIGEWESMEVKGKKLVGVAQYYIGAGNAEADWGFELVKRNRAAFSVGFIPDMDKAEPVQGDSNAFFPPMEFNGQELLEVSHVSIPSNPDALQRMKGLNLDPTVEEVVKEILDDHVQIDPVRVGVGLEVRFDRIEEMLEEIAAEIKRGDEPNPATPINFPELFRDTLSGGT